MIQIFLEVFFLNGKQVCKKLENEGWVCKRIRGSHHIYGKEGRKPVPIPVHGKKDLGIGLLLKIEKETGVKLT
ncbi:hypothetical protein BGP_1463 [Beggiatoa sp. PS]|nr:hypothetical protein BGP_1463 [Beggiatoa sp. PS]